jgi:hypothetical protein
MFGLITLTADFKAFPILDQSIELKALPALVAQCNRELA